MQSNAFTKIFSNASLHWILRDEETREGVLQNIFQLLRPGGSFVFEMGGKGNVAEVHTALIAALMHQGVDIQRAREPSPWFFPSQETMTKLLAAAGFVVEKTETEYRPTKLTDEERGGIEGWVRLMGASFLEALVSEDKKNAAVKEVCDLLKTIITHEEDGSMWLGYVRLRAVARKPSQLAEYFHNIDQPRS